MSDLRKSSSDIPGGGLIETQKGFQPRIAFFHLVIALLFAVLTGGLAYRQIVQSSLYDDRERRQNQRRIVTPGPRGDILDRNGRVLAGSKPLVSVVVLLDELRSEFTREANAIRRNYLKAIEDGVLDITRPDARVINRTARVTVLQRYLDQINRITGRSLQVDRDSLERHFVNERLLPYVLVADLEPPDYARLIEQLPVDSPLQIYPSNARVYPFGPAAAHVIGSVRLDAEIESEQLPSQDLWTFTMPGLKGRDWLEARFDPLLKGRAGGQILRVDPSGYRVATPIANVPATRGGNLTTSLDIDLQLAAEARLSETQLPGAAVALDIRTGEILVLASAPGYDLNEVSPVLTYTQDARIKEAIGYMNRATQGIYMPGSSFKILVTLAGMRAGTISPDSEVDCPGYYMVGNQRFACHDNFAHGTIRLATAIEKSCNVFFYKHGLLTGAEAIAAEARRFGLGARTGIELQAEQAGTIPNEAWRRQRNLGPWRQGDTANVSIGQGDVTVTPIQMAAFTASFARGETRTVPTLIHDPLRTAQHSEPIGIPASSYSTVVQAMEQVTLTGTARIFSQGSMLKRIPGLRIAGKTGTAQKSTPRGTVNFAWFICFAPVDNPQVAIAVVVEGDTPGEEVGGGLYAAPVAHAILDTWWTKQQQAAAAPTP